MAKKVKCKNCLNMMLWALPDDVTAENIDYVKQCVGIAKKTFLCGYTMKTKHREHEQYCKNYEPADFDELEGYDKMIANRERQIAELERRSDERLEEMQTTHLHDVSNFGLEVHD